MFSGFGSRSTRNTRRPFRCAGSTALTRCPPARAQPHRTPLQSFRSGRDIGRERETDPDQRTLVYVSLLPNQEPADTKVLLDDFELAVVDAPAESESRSGNIVEDSGFDAQRTGGIISPWTFLNRAGTNISVEVGGTDAERCVTLQMSKGTSNFLTDAVKR